MLNRNIDKNDIDKVAFTSPYKPGRIILFDGRMPHSLLLELFTEHGVGTIIRKSSN